jgi:hypothetical protein
VRAPRPGRAEREQPDATGAKETSISIASCARVIGALRTHAGDAHGREKGFRRFDARIARFARFAINEASLIALFLIDKRERQQHRALPLRHEAATLDHTHTNNNWTGLRRSRPCPRGVGAVGRRL